MKRLVGFGVLSVVALAFASGCSIEVGGWGSASADGKVVGTYQPLTLAPVPAYDSHCSPAPSLVGSAVCVCNDLSLSGSLRTHAKSGETADVGVGGNVDLASGTRIDGSLRATGEVSSAGSLAVRHHLWAADGVDAAGELEVGGDLASGRDVSGAGDLTVGGLLRVSGENDWAGSKKVNGFGAYTAPTIAPCGCEGAALYDVAKAVAIAKDKNDNDVVHIAKDGMIMVGSSQLTLDSGRYYVKGITSVGDLKLRIRGEVQLYVDGDLESVGENRISIDKGGSLDLFVSGSLSSAGDIELGDRDRPEAFRLYVGGAGSAISLAGSHAFYGVVYAPTSTVSIAGDTEVYGAIFARSLDKAGSLEVYGSKVTSYGERCEAKPVVNPPKPPPPAADSNDAPKPEAPKPSDPPPPPPPPTSDPDPCPQDGGAPDASSGI